MNYHLKELTKSFSKKSKAMLLDIQKTLDFLGVNPPKDYIEFLQESNGGEGFTKSGRYIILESVEQLIPCNEPYGIGASGPGLVTFGSDGGMMLFAFDTRKSPHSIVEVDAVTMGMDRIILHGNSFIGFLEHLNQVNE